MLQGHIIDLSMTVCSAYSQKSMLCLCTLVVLPVMNVSPRGIGCGGCCVVFSVIVRAQHNGNK
jgi:hypothetical protein